MCAFCVALRVVLFDPLLVLFALLLLAVVGAFVHHSHRTAQ
jgi:hypothetical protein